MANWQRRLVGLGLPCLLTWMLDVGLTRHGQPSRRAWRQMHRQALRSITCVGVSVLSAQGTSTCARMSKRPTRVTRVIGKGSLTR